LALNWQKADARNKDEFVTVRNPARKTKQARGLARACQVLFRM